MNNLQRRRELFRAGDYGLLRQLLGMSQAQFWSAIGVSQAAGSRYEASGFAPETITHALRLTHVENIDFRTVSADNIRTTA
ncbi:helix-turn-helix domain-containing protein [Aquitalea magnusonii]|uniref:RsaL-like HTH domain-containing protein n=1 Tax=Aquitalea magnusonii TaxID=332411 RepID=A0A318JVL2_9NEIS|nr:helix-turn-helix transcriptional regulator [Aquitalea magnusonii]PXX49020.1 hypothetical protein DFR38_10556 [Aquitalea magnusonii]